MKPDVRDTVRRETERPPPGAQERVWRALERRLEGPASPRPGVVRRWRPGVAVAVALAAASVGVGVGVGRLTPGRGETRAWRTSGAVLSATGAVVSYAPERNEVSLGRGRLAVSVWGGPPLIISVRGHHVEVEAAVLVVQTAGDSVSIAPVRGWVLVDGERVEATTATRAAAGAPGEEIEALEPKEAAPRRAARLAERAVEARRWEEAASALGELSGAEGLDAEAALVRKGDLELRHLARPEQALATFEEAARRFPAGSLAQERELSALEAELALGRDAEVRARARRFLAAFPHSERAQEVRRASMGAAWREGDRPGACAEARAFPGASPELDEACAAGEPSSAEAPRTNH